MFDLWLLSFTISQQLDVCMHDHASSITANCCACLCHLPCTTTLHTAGRTDISTEAVILFPELWTGNCRHGLCCIHNLLCSFIVGVRFWPGAQLRIPELGVFRFLNWGVQLGGRTAKSWTRDMILLIWHSWPNSFYENFYYSGLGFWFKLLKADPTFEVCRASSIREFRLCLFAVTKSQPDISTYPIVRNSPPLVSTAHWPEHGSSQRWGTPKQTLLVQHLLLCVHHRPQQQASYMMKQPVALLVPEGPMLCSMEGQQKMPRSPRCLAGMVVEGYLDICVCVLCLVSVAMCTSTVLVYVAHLYATYEISRCHRMKGGGWREAQ